MILFALCVGVLASLVVMAACKCARLALKHVQKGEDRPLKAIQTAEAWCKGKATIEQVRAVAYARQDEIGAVIRDVNAMADGTNQAGDIALGQGRGGRCCDLRDLHQTFGVQMLGQHLGNLALLRFQQVGFRELSCFRL